jgi:cadmium resistance protein CadD (predicted permease)
MQHFVSSVMTGITVFVATNLDDLVVLMLFFSQVNAQLRRRHIVSGQYLGFTALLLASLPGFLGRLVIPKLWLGWLGLLPIGIGLLHLLHWGKADNSIQAVSLDASQHSTHADSEPSQSHPKTLIAVALASFLHPTTYEVTAVTIANGGDNISIYVPLFAHQTWAGLGVIVLVFYGMVGVWCGVAVWLTRHPVIARAIPKYGHVIVPVGLIALGLSILLDSGVIATLFQRR